MHNFIYLHSYFMLKTMISPIILWTLRDHHHGVCTLIKSASDIKKVIYDVS